MGFRRGTTKYALGEDKVSEVRRMYMREERSTYEIAEHYGVSQDAVANFLRRWGIPARKTSGKSDTAQRVGVRRRGQ